MPRVKLSEQYKDKREEVCNKIIEIVGTEFLLCDLEDNVEIQHAILSLKDEIQKYFAVSAITPFKPHLEGNVKRDYLIIVKYVVKQLGYNIIGSSFLRNESNGLCRRTTKYKILKSESSENI